MKIAQITPSFYPAHVYGGTTESVYQLCRAASRAGADIRVLTTDANGPRDVLSLAKNVELTLEDGVRVRYCPRRLPESMSPSLLGALEEYVRWADVVHLTAVYSFPTPPTLWMCRKWKKPLVWSPRGALQRWSGSRRVAGKKIWETLCHWVGPPRGVFHVTSDEEAQASLRRFPGFDAAVIPNGVVCDSRPGSRPAREKKLRLLYLGRLDPKKGLENLFQACAIFKTTGQDVSLVIAGAGDPGYETHLKRELKRQHLETDVLLKGMVLGAAKDALFAAADVVVVPSFTENFCIVVAEALARGVPVIASRGTPWRRVEDMECGLWVPNDPQSLSAALMKIERLPLADMGQRGFSWMQKEFSWDAIGQRMVQLYGSLAVSTQHREKTRRVAVS